MERIGVRELRQHASRYLARVESGEAFEVTDRGRLVARLVPAAEDPWEALVSAGLVVPPTGGDLLDVDLVPGPPLSPALDALRAGER